MSLARRILYGAGIGIFLACLSLWGYDYYHENKTKKEVEAYAKNLVIVDEKINEQLLIFNLCAKAEIIFRYNFIARSSGYSEAEVPQEVMDSCGETIFYEKWAGKAEPQRSEPKQIWKKDNGTYL